ncbi:hypothetical protein Pmar_PMAR007849, partial [Perkinsus marinus ATCC 50983]
MECQPSKSILGGDPQYRFEALDIGVNDEVTYKTVTQLGYLWDTVTDTVCPRTIDVGSDIPSTRRLCFQVLSRFYDPLGTNIEYSARQRYLLHKSASTTEHWDSQDLSQSTALEVSALCSVKPCSQPRFVDIRKGLVVFCDAAGSGCICADARGVADGRRLAARQKTLNSKWTIARLELCALRLGVSLLDDICEELDVLTEDGYAPPQVWLLTDSQLNCWRLRRSEAYDAKYLSAFERRRVQDIRSGLTRLAKSLDCSVKSGHVVGRLNPADRATRPDRGLQEKLELCGSEMDDILRSVTTVTLFPGQEDSDGEDEHLDISEDDELDLMMGDDEDLTVALAAAVQLHKDVPDPPEDPELQWSIKVSQAAIPSLRLTLDKIASGKDVPGFETRNGLLCKVGNVALDDTNRGSCAISQIVIPNADDNLQHMVATKVHDQHAGHPGRVTLLRWIWRHYYWQHMDKT